MGVTACGRMGVRSWVRSVKKVCVVGVRNGDFEALEGILSARGGFVPIFCVLAVFTSANGGVAPAAAGRLLACRSKIEDGGSKIVEWRSGGGQKRFAVGCKLGFGQGLGNAGD